MTGDSRTLHHRRVLSQIFNFYLKKKKLPNSPLKTYMGISHSSERQYQQASQYHPAKAAVDHRERYRALARSSLSDPNLEGPQETNQTQASPF